MSDQVTNNSIALIAGSIAGAMIARYPVPLKVPDQREIVDIAEHMAEAIALAVEQGSNGLLLAHRAAMADIRDRGSRRG